MKKSFKQFLIESVNFNQIKIEVAQIAQQIYDNWDESDEDTYAGGGICHLIADAIVDYLFSKHIEATTFNQTIDEVHVFILAKFDDGVYRVDIPPWVYEKGSGYSWTKIPNVEFDASDVIIDKISPNLDDFEQYTEEY